MYVYVTMFWHRAHQSTTSTAETAWWVTLYAAAARSSRSEKDYTML